MQYTLILRILGLLSVFLGGAMLLPIPFSIYYGSNDIEAIALSALITLTFGSLGFLTNKPGKDLRPKEGFAVVTLGWIVMSLLGSLPYMLSGAIPSFTDAFFESISGFTTTGATILTDIESLPEGILFWRSLTHWIGGMGIIVLSLAILPFLGVGGMQLFKAEAPGPVVDKLKPRITETAKILWGVYLLFTVTETIFLLFGGMNLFDSLCHTFGTMATGGFSTKNASVGYYKSAYIDFVIIIYMIIAGTNFSLHFRLLRGKFKDVWSSEEFRFYLGIISIATIIIGVDTYFNNYSGVFESIQYTLFQVISIMTTTGYGTADYEQWAYSSQILLFMLMFVGGCAGSTGGGIKVIRIFLLIKFVRAEIVRLVHPQAVIPIRLGNTVVDRQVMMNILGFFLIFMLIFIIGTFLVALTGLDIESSFGLVAATLNNIGPGLGLVGPTDNYAHLHIIAKWLSSFFMLMGRLEVFTVIILLAPAYWRK